jgi:hypothetical protein
VNAPLTVIGWAPLLLVMHVAQAQLLPVTVSGAEAVAGPPVVDVNSP